MKETIFAKIKREFPAVKENESLKEHTTFKVGGMARYFLIVKNKEDLAKALKLAKQLKLSVFVLGGGSNVVFEDKDFKGLVIKMQNQVCELQGNKIVAGAGTTLSDLAKFASESGLSGLEWSAGIPKATVGGAVFGNAQAFGQRISDIIKSVEILDTKTLEFKKFAKEQCGFNLKNSVFKKTAKNANRLIIVSAVFLLKNKDKEVITEKIKEFLKYRKDRHPLNFPSAGSVFVNPEIYPVKFAQTGSAGKPLKYNGQKTISKELVEKFPELEEFNKKGVIHAGYLIEKAGLKGKKIGNAQISEKHANFIINLGGAKAKDIENLINFAKQKVKKIFNIDLETEIQIIKMP
jgi:UDP-N-acetylmuramate dehydrogenase